MREKFISAKLKAIAASCFLILFYGCENRKHQGEKEILAEVLTVNPVESSSTCHYTGIIEESFSSMISFQVGGNIKQIHCEENQYVEKGQLLATLDNVIYQNNYDVAHSSYKQAEDAYQRMKALYEDSSLPEVKWIEVQTTLQNAQSMLNVAKNDLNNCDLHAPFSGVIAKRITETGANIMPGMPVFNLTKIDKVKAKVAIPEKEVSKIKVNQRVAVQVMALGEDKRYEADIREKGTIANLLSHTYDVKIELDNKDRQLMPGMICNVDIFLDEGAEYQIVIPSHSIMIDNNNNRFVWLVDNNTAHKQAVTISTFSDHGVIVETGLKKGDQIIVNGNQKVSEGMKIKRQ